MSPTQVAMITGVSSGIGRVTAEVLAARGFHVFGSVRSPSASVPAGVHPLLLDVRDDASVERAVSEVLARTGRIDVLVNNAGGTVIGAIEETDLGQAQALFDTNFFGAVRVTRAVLPVMRARRSGRIVFVSSIAGFLPTPFMGFYAASKHALEGYSESLDHEVRTLGIRSIVVQPGFMKTSIDKNTVYAARDISDYGERRDRIAQGINARVQSGEEPSLVAEAIVHALAADKPRLRYPVGKGAGALGLLRGLLPEPLFDRSLRKQFHLDDGA